MLEIHFVCVCGGGGWGCVCVCVCLLPKTTKYVNSEYKHSFVGLGILVFDKH